MQACTHKRAHTHASMRPSTHTHLRMRAHMHTSTHARNQPNSRACTRTHAPALLPVRTHMHRTHPFTGASDPCTPFPPLGGVACRAHQGTCAMTRSKPTANAEDPSRSEGALRCVSPFRRHPPIRTSPWRSPWHEKLFKNSTPCTFLPPLGGVACRAHRCTFARVCACTRVNARMCVLQSAAPRAREHAAAFGKNVGTLGPRDGLYVHLTPRVGVRI